MKRTTKINGVELDLRGISIDFEHIGPDEYNFTVGSDKREFDSRLINIVDVLRGIFDNVQEKVEKD
jgi:hypothetical protein